MNRGLIIALLLSLAANVFFGGFVVGRFVAGPPPPEAVRQGGQAIGFMNRRSLEMLSAEDQETVRAVFRSQRRVVRAKNRILQERRGDLANAIAADPWDRARVEAAAAALQEAQRDREALFAALLIEALEELSPEDRAALANARVDPSRPQDRPRRPRPGGGPRTGNE
jgi:Spy/CpxP family protein refolding chaperone